MILSVSTIEGTSGEEQRFLPEKLYYEQTAYGSKRLGLIFCAPDMRAAAALDVKYLR